MEILVSIALIIGALAILFEKLTNLFKQLHASRPKGLLGAGKFLKIGITISSENKKSEVCDDNTNSNTERLD